MILHLQKKRKTHIFIRIRDAFFHNFCATQTYSDILTDIAHKISFFLKNEQNVSHFKEKKVSENSNT